MRLFVISIFSLILPTLLLSLLTTTVIDAKKGGSSGGGSRGGGGGSSGGGFGTGGGGARPGSVGGGGRPAGGGGGFGGGPQVNRPMGGGVGGAGGGFHSGTSVNTASRGGFLQGRTSQLVVAGLAGAAIGAGTYGLISAANSHYTHPDTGRTYYMGDRYAPAQPQSGRFLCKYEIKENDTSLANMHYDNNTRVKEVFYECKLNQEYCCNGLDCCKSQPIVVQQEQKRPSLWGGIIIALLCVTVIGGCGYCIYLQVRKSTAATNYNQQDQQVYPEATYSVYQTNDQHQQQYPSYPTNQQQAGPGGYYPTDQSNNVGYPTGQPYGGGGYPAQHPGAYPAQNQPPQNYPAAPPTQSYGFAAQPPPSYPPGKYP